MTKSKAVMLFGLPVLLVAGYALYLLLLMQPGFNGSRVKNPDAYLLDIQTMNGTDQHSLALQQGDRLQIRFVTEKGALTMAITGPDGTELYSGNGRDYGFSPEHPGKRRLYHHRPGPEGKGDHSDSEYRGGVNETSLEDYSGGRRTAGL